MFTVYFYPISPNFSSCPPSKTSSISRLGAKGTLTCSDSEYADVSKTNPSFTKIRAVRPHCE